MQSMMVGETEILTPGGEYNRWTPITKVDRFSRSQYPEFCHFIEKSPYCYSASYLLGSGLGDRRYISNDDWVFIGNSYGKSYHKLMGDVTVKEGMKTSWSGIYTWFINPLVDKNDEFTYIGYANGRKSIFRSTEDGTHVFPQSE